MKSRPRGIPQLDLYLAATMRPSDSVSAILEKTSITREILEEAKRRANIGGLADPRTVSTGVITSLFGKPLISQPDCLTYQSFLWPNHQYDWNVHAHSIVSHGGFRLVVSDTLPGWLPVTFNAARTQFIPFFHTSHDIQAILGEPNKTLNWGTAWDWHFEESEGSGDLVFDFDHGLLREIRLEKGDA